MAPNGAEGLAMMKRRHYDVVFMDMVMPQMGGLEAVSHRREWEKTIGRNNRQTVCMISGQDMAASRVRGSGVDFVESKPCSVTSLQRILDSVEKN